jgi:nicotinate dehydrogenase subunit A
VTETISLTVNGEARHVVTEPDTTLLEVLRERLGLKGTRFGCGTGSCGACLVLLDGAPTPSCELPVASAARRDVTTVEGLGRDGRPHPLQTALLAEQAVQCGYCVSGILIGGAALLASNPHPDATAVAAALDRNLCRCGAQRRIIRAVLRAAEESTS